MQLGNDRPSKTAITLNRHHHNLRHNHNLCSRAGRFDGLGTVEEMALARAGAWATLLTMFWTSMALKS